MRPGYRIERHIGRHWIATNFTDSKVTAFEILESYRSNPLPDANEYRIMKLEHNEIAWLDIRESKNTVKHDAQSLSQTVYGGYSF